MKVKVNYVALSQIFPARTIEPRRRGLELVAGSWELWEIGGMLWQINREHTRK